MLGRTLPSGIIASTVSRPLSTPPPSFDALGSEHLSAIRLHTLKPALEPVRVQVLVSMLHLSGAC